MDETNHEDKDEMHDATWSLEEVVEIQSKRKAPSTTVTKTGRKQYNEGVPVFPLREYYETDQWPLSKRDPDCWAKVLHSRGWQSKGSALRLLPGFKGKSKKKYIEVVRSNGRRSFRKSGQGIGEGYWQSHRRIRDKEKKQHTYKAGYQL